jgi:hypothetical protein
VVVEAKAERDRGAGTGREGQRTGDGEDEEFGVGIEETGALDVDERGAERRPVLGARARVELGAEPHQAEGGPAPAVRLVQADAVRHGDARDVERLGKGAGRGPWPACARTCASASPI